jgi:hypothetical protein
MSRQEVRNAVGTYLAGTPITNLNQIFTSFPKRINFEQNATVGSYTRVAGVVHIQGESEARVALGGAYSGWKRIDYDVIFQLFCHSMQNYSQDAMTDFDNVVDSVKGLLRSGGHRLGLSDGSVIWQAAEPGISVQYGEPKTNDGGAVELWAGIEFTVTQMIQA